MNRTNHVGIRKCYEISTLHAERLAVGTDGKAYITLDLYFTFHKLLLKTRVSLMDLYATLQSLKGPYLHILVQDMDTIKMPPKSIHEGTKYVSIPLIAISAKHVPPFSVGYQKLWISQVTSVVTGML